MKEQTKLSLPQVLAFPAEMVNSAAVSYWNVCGLEVCYFLMLRIRTFLRVMTMTCF